MPTQNLQKQSCMTIDLSIHLRSLSPTFQNHASIAAFPSILNIEHLTSLIRPSYEEGKKIYNQVSNEMVALLESIMSPNNDEDSGEEDYLACAEHDAEEDYDMKPFVCG